VHWKEYGLFEGFEKYVQQYQEKSNYDPEIRKAWIQEIIAEHKAKREGQKSTKPKPPGPEPSFVNTCRELTRMMPFGFNPTAAEGMEAIYQFEITGDEEFISHLRISRGECTYHEGPADHPSIKIKSPADVWLAISKGSLDGQYAFMSGKFSAEGDLRLLLKLKSVFSVK
jgi:putative sterol carrier protein